AVVRRPGAFAPLPPEGLDQIPQLLDVGPDQLGGEPCLRQGAADLLSGEPRLGPGLAAAVEDGSRGRLAAGGQQTPHLGAGGAFGVAPQPRLERNPAPRLHQEGVEELAAELAVADPGLALAVLLERSDVDELGAAADELDVVGRGVL